MKKIIEAYNAGYDCEIHGPDIINCHFSFFATKELAYAHKKGKIDARNDRS